MPPLMRWLPAGFATAATTATTSTTETATTAARACRHRLRLVDGEVTAAKIVIVQLLDRLLRLFVGAHLNEAEAARSTGSHVAHDLDAFDRAAAREELFEILLPRAVRKVSHVKFSTHR